LNYKGYIVCSLIAALLCVTSIVFLAKEIRSAEQRVHSEGAVRLFNFAFKMGRNFDELAHSLTMYRDCRSFPPQPPRESSRAYVEKFDVLWSGFKNAYRNISRYWSTTGYWLDQDRADIAADIRDRGLAFLDKYKSDMQPEDSIACERIDEMLFDIYQEKDAISGFAHSYVALDSEATAEQRRGIAYLNNFILFLSASLLITMLLTAALVFKAITAAQKSYRRSEVAAAQAKVALAELRKSDDKNIAQKYFFASASHDLRQPLHALGLYLGALEKYVDSEQAEHILSRAALSTELLSAQLDSILDLSRLDTGIIKPDNSEFRLKDLLSRLHDRFQPEVVEKGLSLVCSADDSIVNTDNQLLDRILQNLLSNALAYTESGRIEISGLTVDAEVLITIRDTGKGIPELEQEVVFNEFYHLGVSQNRGLGLGLSIVRRLSELLKLKLEMSSQEGVGTTFTLKLPVVRPK